MMSLHGAILHRKQYNHCNIRGPPTGLKRLLSNSLSLFTTIDEVQDLNRSTGIYQIEQIESAAIRINIGKFGYHHDASQMSYLT